MLARVRARVRGPPRNPQQIAEAETAALSKKQRRRKAIFNAIYCALSAIRIVLFVAGYAWMLLLPSPQLGRGIYIDENALQPGQVNTYWSWGDVHSADVYLERLEQLRSQNASSLEKASSLKSVFSELGIPAATQAYSFRTGAESLNGVNTYAVLSAPRTSGTEAIVIAASWASLTTGPNLRGVATVLSLASYLKRYSLWAKDIVFVISDGYLDGMQAWLGAYHGVDQSNLDTEPLKLHSGVIWTGLVIDYPGHSFSHLGVFYEGLNGRLPNQDLMNSFNFISTYTGGVPVVLYNHLDEEIDSQIPLWMPQVLRDHADIREYAKRARNIVRHVRYQALGRASGVHGLFHRFRIDAITLFAVPAIGPHGFHALGRVIESTLRTMNNLLERLHASFFFYLLTGPGTFLKIGEYLPSAVIVSVAMMFGGLHAWVDAGWVEKQEARGEKDDAGLNAPAARREIKWIRRRRDILPALAIMLMTHVVGGIVFLIVTNSWFITKTETATSTSYLPIIPLSLIVFSILSALLSSVSETESHSSASAAPLSTLLKAFNLCLASTVISITSVLNFSLAATLALLLGVPLSLASPTKAKAKSRSEPKSTPFIPKMLKAMTYLSALVLGPVWWVGTRDAVWDWEVLGGWVAPFVCMVYLPLVLQATVVCMLDS